MNRRSLAAMGILALTGALLGSGGPDAEWAALAHWRTTLDVQTARVFTNAVLFKPHAAESQNLTHTLAPLLIHEFAGPLPSRLPAEHRPGTVDAQVIDMGRPAVYAQQGSLLVNGHVHAQVGFAWCYPAPASRSGKPQVRGVRLILNSRGEPVIWAPLIPGKTNRVFFIAESLERAAAAQHGFPLPGRRFSVERSPAEQPDVLVARLIDDGPIPMGPMVYVQAEANAITTILCRCMSAQVKNIIENHYYELLPVEALPDPAECQSDSVADATEALRLLTVSKLENGEDSDLVRLLRLPDEF